MALKWKILFFIPLISTVYSSCPENSNKTLDRVNCSEKIDLSHQRYTYIKPTVFIPCKSKIDDIILSHNCIKEFKPDTFQLDLLTTLLLDNNELKYIGNNVFHGLKSLQFLDLHANRLDKLDSNTFSDLAALTKLNIGHNGIQELPSKLLTSLKNLKVFDVEHNKIRFIPKDYFSGLIKLERITLSENEISYLDTEMFDGLSNLQSIYFERNRIMNFDVNKLISLPLLKTIYMRDNSLLCDRLENIKRLFKQQHISSDVLMGESECLDSDDFAHYLEKYLNDQSISDEEKEKIASLNEENVE